jgi:hypothetical protein
MYILRRAKSNETDLEQDRSDKLPGLAHLLHI